MWLSSRGGPAATGPRAPAPRQVLLGLGAGGEGVLADAPVHPPTLRAEAVRPHFVPCSHPSLPLPRRSSVPFSPYPRPSPALSLSLPSCLLLWLPLMLSARPSPLFSSPQPPTAGCYDLGGGSQALLGFGVWDGSGRVGGEGGPQGSAQHQDQRAPHGQEGRAAGRVRGQRPRPLPTPSPPPVCPGAPRPPPHLPAGLLSSGHWPLAPQRLLDPNTSLRSSLCSFRCLFEPQPSSTADHAPGPSPALGHAHPTLPRPCPQDWPRLDASTTPRAKASLHPPPRLYLGLAPSTLAFLNLSSGRPPSSAWGALPRTAPERSPSHFASLLLVTTVHCPKAMVSSVLSNFLV